MEVDPLRIVQELAHALHKKKGMNVIALDIRKVSSTTDFVLIANGTVEQHVKALANEIQRAMREKGKRCCCIEGVSNNDWMVLDYFEIVIHLLIPKMREKYQLERLWSDGEIIDLDFSKAINEREVKLK